MQAAGGYLWIHGEYVRRWSAMVTKVNKALDQKGGGEEDFRSADVRLRCDVGLSQRRTRYWGRSVGENYLREPRLGFFSFVWRVFSLLRFGLLMIKVPLPMYSAL